jgi:hypothetical protein
MKLEFVVKISAGYEYQYDMILLFTLKKCYDSLVHLVDQRGP